MIPVAPIPGFGSYAATAFGEILTFLRNKIEPVGWTGADGYRRIAVDGKQHMVHRLVLEAFVGPCPEGMECRHLDGDRSNNAIGNLRWGTPKENAGDQIVHGTRIRGESLWSSKLTVEDVLWIDRELKTSSLTISQIADHFGVSGALISNIKAGRKWSWLTGRGED